jgi:hypothetical protein
MSVAVGVRVSGTPCSGCGFTALVAQAATRTATRGTNSGSGTVLVAIHAWRTSLPGTTRLAQTDCAGATAGLTEVRRTEWVE